MQLRALHLLPLALGALAIAACAQDRFDPARLGLVDDPFLETSNSTCSDGIDNDGDGAIDCLDDDCDPAVAVGITVCFGPELGDVFCRDGIDNDGDGFVDCADNDCRNDDDATNCGDEDSDARCSDGIDNDGNGFVDCGDFACEGLADCAGQGSREDSDALCSDMMDNDGDGFVDCMDFDCEDLPVCAGAGGGGA